MQKENNMAYKGLIKWVILSERFEIKRHVSFTHEIITFEHDPNQKSIYNYNGFLKQVQNVYLDLIKERINLDFFNIFYKTKAGDQVYINNDASFENFLNTAANTLVEPIDIFIQEVSPLPYSSPICGSCKKSLICFHCHSDIFSLLINALKIASNVKTTKTLTTNQLLTLCETINKFEEEEKQLLIESENQKMTDPDEWKKTKSNPFVELVEKQVEVNRKQCDSPQASEPKKKYSDLDRPNPEDCKGYEAVDWKNDVKTPKVIKHEIKKDNFTPKECKPGYTKVDDVDDWEEIGVYKGSPKTPDSRTIDSTKVKCPATPICDNKNKSENISYIVPKVISPIKRRLITIINGKVVKTPDDNNNTAVEVLTDNRDKTSFELKDPPANRVVPKPSTPAVPSSSNVLASDAKVATKNNIYADSEDEWEDSPPSYVTRTKSKSLTPTEPKPKVFSKTIPTPRALRN